MAAEERPRGQEVEWKGLVRGMLRVKPVEIPRGREAAQRDLAREKWRGDLGVEGYPHQRPFLLMGFSKSGRVGGKVQYAGTQFCVTVLSLHVPAIKRSTNATPTRGMSRDILFIVDGF